MNELPLESFQHAIRKTHGAKSQLLTREPVVEKFKGETVWEGEVLVSLSKTTQHTSASLGGGRPGDGCSP